MVLRILFLKISNVNKAFSKGMLTWRSYTTNKALSTTEQIQLVNPKEFVIAALDADNETFVVHVAVRKREKMAMDAARKAQIKMQSGVQTQDKAQVRALLFDEALTEAPVKNSDYNNVFSAENAVELPENIEINEHAIKLEEDKQPPFGPIYSLGPIELEKLKIYIKINLANGFIRQSKFLAGASILLDRKPDGSFHLCVDYSHSALSIKKTNIRYL